MTSLHAIAIPPVVRGLKNAAAFLQKAVDQAAAEQIDVQIYLSGRLHPTMGDFPFQIYRLTDHAKAIPKRINPSIEGLTLPDVETTFPELIERIEKTAAYLEKIEPASLNGKEGGQVVFSVNGPGGVPIELKWETVNYVFEYAHPSFWFHVTTAYDILRKEGVNVGKADFLNGARLTKIG